MYKKAKELVDKMYLELSDLCVTEDVLDSIAKQTALICVDEQRFLITDLVTNNQLSVRVGIIAITELDEVKQEIIKL